jgi:2',3'-cyclic-nucleotide 2'-phosphodiesterase (5'-nucleotidase family)
VADNVDFEAVDWTDSSVIIGYSAASYTTADRATRETALGNLATDALAWYVRHRLPEEYRKNVDFAYTNGNGLQSTGEIPAGSITISSARTNVMKGDSIYIFPITGTQLKTVLHSNRNNVTQVSKELKYTIDFTGEEVVVSNITVNGVAIQDNTTYWAASGRSPSGVGAEQGRITVPEEHGKFNTIIPYYVYVLQTSQENPLTLSDSGRITVIRSGETGGGGDHEHMH